MKHLLLLAAFCVTVTHVWGQWVEPPQFEWAKSFGGPGSDSVADWIIGPDGSIYLTGSYLSWLRFDDTIQAVSPWADFQYDAYVMKIGPDLQVAWVQSLGGIDEDQGIGIDIDSKGRLYWTGNYRGNIAVGEDSLYSYSFLSNPNRTYGGIFCIMLDPESGKVDSSFSFGGDIYTYLEAFSITEDDALVFSGICWGSLDFVFGEDTTSWTSADPYSVFVIHYYPTKTRSTITSFSAFDVGNHDISYMGINHNGDVHITGYTRGKLTYKDSTIYDGDSRPYHAILDSRNKLKLFQTFPQRLIIKKVVFDQWSNYFIIGEAREFFPEESNTYPYQEGMMPGIVIQKSNLDGFNTKWLNYPGETNRAVSAIPDDENLILVGAYSDSIVFNNVRVTPNSVAGNSDDAFIAKIDREGNIVWARTAGGPYGERIFDILERFENQYVVLGNLETGFTYMDSFFLSQPFVLPYEWDHFLGILSQDSSGPPLPYIGNAEESRFTLFPNPSSGKMTLFGNWKQHDWSLAIYSTLGQLAFSKIESTNEGQTRISLDLSELASGHYYLRIHSTNFQQVIPFILN